MLALLATVILTTLCDPTQRALDAQLNEPVAVDFSISDPKAPPPLEQASLLNHILRFGQLPKDAEKFLPPGADVLPDARAISLDPTSGKITIDWRYVPTAVEPHLRDLLRVLPLAKDFKERARQVFKFANDATRTHGTPYQEAEVKARAALGDYTQWPAPYGVEQSESPINRGKKRVFFRNPEGTQAVAFTYEAGEPEKREMLVTIKDAETGELRLVAIAESRGKNGEIKQEENRTCYQCHALNALRKRIVTQVPRVGMSEAIPAAHSMNEGFQPPSW